MTRHASMASQLSAIKAATERPVMPAEPMQTNWSPIAANDNNPEDVAEKSVERRWAMRPTLDEIEREMETEATYGERFDGQGKVIVSIGKLQFSDGSATERAYAYGPDGKVIMYDARLPVGAMLKTKDAQERTLGGDGVDNSNAVYSQIYKAQHPGKIRRRSPEDIKKDRENDKKLTKAKMRAELAAAMAKPGVPKVTICKPGFPWKASNLRDLFLGVEKGKKGETGSLAWQDISTHIIEREVWAETIASLSDEDKSTLDAVESAKNMADIGKAHGKSGKNAERRGKRYIIAANDNIRDAYKKATA